MRPVDPADLERLSAYLDDALPAEERAQMSTRLDREPALRALRDELRLTKAILRAAPTLAPPRNFTLDPGRANSDRRAASPIDARVALRWAIGLAALFIVAFLARAALINGGSVVTQQAAGQAVAAAPTNNVIVTLSAAIAAPYSSATTITLVARIAPIHATGTRPAAAFSALPTATALPSTPLPPPNTAIAQLAPSVSNQSDANSASGAALPAIASPAALQPSAPIRLRSLFDFVLRLLRLLLERL